MSQEDKSKGFDWAVKNGDLAGIKDYVEKQGVSVNIVDSNQRTPAHWASDYNQVEALQYLIGKGAKIDQPDRYGITPLLAAVYEGHKGAVELLVNKGAKLNVKGPDGKTALEAAEKDDIKKILAAKK